MGKSKHISGKVGELKPDSYRLIGIFWL